MKINKSRAKKILVVGLSNIGDAILTTPVIQVLRREFPKGHIAILVGPRAFDVFKNDRRIDRKIIYDKGIRLRDKLGLINRLRQDKYDLVVDLRQSLFGIFLGARYRTSMFGRAPKSLIHMKNRHLWKLKSLGLNIKNIKQPFVEFGEDDRSYVNQMLAKWQIKQGQVIVAVAPGARNITKRWEIQKYRQVVERLIKGYNIKIIIVGDGQDKALGEELISRIKPVPINACGKTTIGQLAFLLSRCKLLITNDSAPMHLGWAVDTPVVAIFGPTDYRKYAPDGPHNVAIHKDVDCAPCEQSLCRRGTRDCIKSISAEEIFSACKDILDGNF